MRFSIPAPRTLYGLLASTGLVLLVVGAVMAFIAERDFNAQAAAWDAAVAEVSRDLEQVVAHADSANAAAEAAVSGKPDAAGWFREPADTEGIDAEIENLTAVMDEGHSAAQRYRVARTVVLVGAVLALVGFIGWYSRLERHRTGSRHHAGMLLRASRTEPTAPSIRRPEPESDISGDA